MSKIICILTLLFISSCSVSKLKTDNLNPIPSEIKNFENVDVNDDMVISVEEYENIKAYKYDNESPVKWFLFIVFVVFGSSLALSFFTKKT